MSRFEVISIKPHDKVVLAQVEPNRLDATTAAQLEDEVSQAVQAAPDKPIVLDFANVKFAPSVVLGSLVNLFKGLRMSGRRLYVVGVNRQIRGTLSVTRLDALISVRDSVDSVLTEL